MQTSFIFERKGIVGEIGYDSGRGLCLCARRGKGDWRVQEITEADAEKIVAEVRGGNGRATFDRWQGADNLKQAVLADEQEVAAQLYPDDPAAQLRYLFGLPDEKLEKLGF